jgi:hypothetical protein
MSTKRATRSPTTYCGEGEAVVALGVATVTTTVVAIVAPSPINAMRW